MLRVTSSENDAHGGAAYQGNADGGPGGLVHSAEGGFELQTSLLTDKGIQMILVLEIRLPTNLYLKV